MTPLRVNIITIVIVLALLGGFLFGLLFPGMNALHEQQAAVDEKLSEIARQQREVGEVGPAYEALTAVEKSVLAVKRRVPCTPEFGDFLNDLTRAVENTGVKNYQIQPLPDRRVDGENLPEAVQLAKGTGIVAVQLTVHADFESIFNVLARIDDLQRLVHIEKFKVEPASAGGPLRAQIEVHAYQFCNPAMQVCDHAHPNGPAAGGAA